MKLVVHLGRKILILHLKCGFLTEIMQYNTIKNPIMKYLQVN